ncbi:hypothetical protein F5Y17DRAFT_469241 [Xylariaceae sp. FL0594]|nr:hypothetical protein F5Y17DRAFT_469241 [Xylariaceae sp. FL0594]
MVKQSTLRQVTSQSAISKTEDPSALARRRPAYEGHLPAGDSDVRTEILNQTYVRRDQQRSPDRRSARANDPMEQHEAKVASRLAGNAPENAKGVRRQTPEEYIAHRKTVIIDKAMAVFQRWLDKRLAVMSYTIEASEAAEGSGDPGDSSGGNQDRGNGGKKPEDTNRRPKRQFSDGNDPGNSGGRDDDNGQDRGGSKRAKKESESGGVKLACPFYKHNPKAHTRKGCVTGAWESIHRLKEHLYRVHLLPKYKCPRCNLGCKSDKELEDHLRADEPCRKSSLVREEGIDPEMEKKLRERKKHNSGETSGQQWIKIYLILFPAANLDAIPNPYPDYDGTTASSNREQFRRVEKRIKKELPRIFKKQLERKLGKMEDRLLQDVPDLLRNSIAEVFKDLPADDASSPTTSQNTSRETTPGPSSALELNCQYDPSLIFDISECFDNIQEWGNNWFPLGPLGGLTDIQSEMDACENVSATEKISTDSGYASSFQ